MCSLEISKEPLSQITWIQLVHISRCCVESFRYFSINIPITFTSLGALLSRPSSLLKFSNCICRKSNDLTHFLVIRNAYREGNEALHQNDHNFYGSTASKITSHMLCYLTYTNTSSFWKLYSLLESCM